MIFSGQKLLAELTKKCVLVHHQAESNSPGSTIILDFVLDEVLINDVLKDKNSTNMLLMFDLMSSLSSDMKKTQVFYCDDCWLVTANPAFIYCIYAAVFPTLKQNVMQVLCYFKSVTRKSQMALHRHNHKHPMRCNAQHYG
jgi:hypothetical protein